MQWSPEAEKKIGRAPGFVQSRVRLKAEKEARRAGLAEISAEFLERLMKEPHGSGRSFPLPAVTADPLHQAFERKYAIHAGMMTAVEAAGDPEELFRRQVAESSSVPDRPAVAYAHIPFCSSRCLFCGFYACASRSQEMRDYAEKLSDEIRTAGEMLKKAGRSLKAVYFGGGTPTDLSAASLSSLFGTVRENLPLSPGCEMTLEGRLFNFDDDKLTAALEAGVTRFSFGVQSFDTDIRQRLGRRLNRGEIISRLNQIVAAAEPYRAAVVIDLIYGLPGQDRAAVLDDIDAAANRTGIHGLDLYQVNLIPGTPMVQRRDELPPMADLRAQGDMFIAGRGRLLECGFQRLSAAHWGRDAREKNIYNSSIKQGVDCFPLGAGGGGRWGRFRFMQQSDVALYKAGVESGCKPLAAAVELPFADAVVSAAIGQLDGCCLDPEKLDAVAGRPLDGLLRPELRLWEQAGLIRPGKPWRLTPAGEFWAVNLQQLLTELFQKRGGSRA